MLLKCHCGNRILPAANPQERGCEQTFPAAELENRLPRQRDGPYGGTSGHATANDPPQSDRYFASNRRDIVPGQQVSNKTKCLLAWNVASL